MISHQRTATHAIWIFSLFFLASILFREAQPSNPIDKSELSTDGPFRKNSKHGADEPLLFYRSQPLVKPGDSVESVMRKLGPGKLVQSGYTTFRHKGFFCKIYSFEGLNICVEFSELRSNFWGIGANRLYPSGELPDLRATPPKCRCPLCWPLGVPPWW